jgi:TolB-like protein/Tfp pilus assembly protein PilF
MNLYTDEIAEPKKPANAKPEEPFASASSSLPSPRKGRRALTATVLVVAALALGFGFWSLSRRLAPEITAPASVESAYVASFPEKTIAVLPFEDLSETKEDAFLVDGVQDDILTALSKVADLKVISRTSVSTYAPGKPRNFRDIAQSLGAAYILEGSVRRAGEKARITVQLTDARRDAKLWTESYERDLPDVFGMQSDIVQRVAAQTQATVSPKEKAAIDERPTKDVVAYGLYVRGKDLIASVSFNAQINEKLSQAVQLLDQAIARDRNFYLAYCQLAAAHNYLYFFGLDHTPARLALADAALKTVVRLRPDAGETHLAKATFFYRCYLDYEKARAELALTQHALPNNSEIFELTGYIDRRQNLWSESARSLQKALELDPRNFFILQQIASSYQEFRQFGAMAAALDRALALVPRDLDTRVTRALVDLEWRADTRPLHQTIYALLAENPAATSDLGDQWLYVSLCERDPAAAARALAAIPATGIATDLNFPRAWCEGLAARARGDGAVAQSAFAAARAEIEQTVNEQPNYGPAFCVLGLIDAALGRKEESIREGRRAVELLPVTKDSIDGAELMKYLGVIYAWSGEKDLAIQQVAATLKIPSTLSYGNLKLHPYWDPLRGDPRFEKIVTDLAPRDAEN